MAAGESQDPILSAIGLIEEIRELLQAQLLMEQGRSTCEWGFVGTYQFNIDVGKQFCPISKQRRKKYTSSETEKNTKSDALDLVSLRYFRHNSLKCSKYIIY